MICTKFKILCYGPDSSGLSLYVEYGHTDNNISDYKSYHVQYTHKRNLRMNRQKNKIK